MSLFPFAKDQKEFIESQVSEASKALKAIPGVGSGSMGLTPDHVKESKEYKEAKAYYDDRFERLRHYNRWYVKTFKKELAAERKERYNKVNP